MEMFFRVLLMLTASGTALGLTVFLLSRLLKKRIPATAVYVMWMLVFLRLALPLPGLISLPALTNTQSTGNAQTQTANTGYTYPRAELSVNSTEYGVSLGLSSVEADNAANDASLSGDEQVKGAAEGIVRAVTPKVASQADAKTPLYKDIRLWLCVWAAGAIMSLMRTFTGFIRFKRALNRTLKPVSFAEASVLTALNNSAYPALYRSAFVSAPLLIGLIRPIIVLPEREYSAEALDGMLRHELIHYRRGDLALKWLTALVQSAHWFNPIIRLFKAQMMLYCELSCDEWLLRSIDGQQKQRYGETLLSLAADTALPRGVIAVSFATQKRDLKERLVQIMTYKRFGKRAIALAIAAMMAIGGCAWVLGPRLTGVAENVQANASNEADEIEYIRVTNVQELIAAIGSNREITLATGEYCLSNATGSGAYITPISSREDMGNGGLLISGIQNLTLIGEDGAKIVTEPREADVITLYGCSNIALFNLSVGHTQRPELCEGGVILLESSGNIDIYSCDLYGCGTVGIIARDCWNVNVYDTVIRECSVSAIEVSSSFRVKFMGLDVYSCGIKSDGGASNMALVYTEGDSDVGIYRSMFHDNSARSLIDARYGGKNIELLACQIANNSLSTGFELSESIVVEGCAFTDNAFGTGHIYSAASMNAISKAGEALSEEDLLSMQYVPYNFEIEPNDGENEAYVDEAAEYHVTSADEFIEALGSNRTIYVDNSISLSDAIGYGTISGESYYWSGDASGYTFTVYNVENLSIIGAGRDETSIEILNRNADVMAFKGCNNLTIQGITMGHTRGAGTCVGDVLRLVSCESAALTDVGLFGCGVNGINAVGCVNLSVTGSEIYECSFYAALLTDCQNARFEDVYIHDNAENYIFSDTPVTTLGIKN